MKVHGSTISRNQFVFIAGLAIFLVIGYCLLQNTQQTGETKFSSCLLHLYKTKVET